MIYACRCYANFKNINSIVRTPTQFRNIDYCLLKYLRHKILCVKNAQYELITIYFLFHLLFSVHYYKPKIILCNFLFILLFEIYFTNGNNSKKKLIQFFLISQVNLPNIYHLVVIYPAAAIYSSPK